MGAIRSNQKHPKNLAGMFYGDWRVIEYVGKNKFGHQFWLCECKCGKIAEVDRCDLTDRRGHNCCFDCAHKKRRVYPDKKLCKECGVPFGRSMTVGGRLEPVRDFMKRKYCCRKCFRKGQSKHFKRIRQEASSK